MIMLDNTVVNLALPSIRADLGISLSELEWVVNAYALTFGVLLLSGGKLADLLGRRAIFIAGLAIFAGASLGCSLASGAASLIAARTSRGRCPRAGKADGEDDVLARIAEMPEPDRAVAERLHAMINASAPALSPRTWYGMPAYARDGKVVCVFQSAQKFKTSDIEFINDD